MRSPGLMGGILALALSAPVLAQQAPPQAGQRQQAPPQAGQRQQARERQIGAMFLRLDKNQDAAVSKDEWPRGEQAFTRLDVNQDGVLSQEELRRAATPRQVMQQRIRARMVQRQLRRMDVNQDRTITRDEWKGRPELFDRIDADKSGTLTASEIRQFRARQRGGRAR
jgi:Ca2+-binding EF-hand superfamily protein